MSYDYLLSAGDFCQSMTILISLTAYLPQWLTMVQTRSSENVSVYSWIIWLLSSSLTIFYALVQYWVHGAAIVLLFSSTMNILFILVTLVLIVRFRKTARQVAADPG